MSYFRISFDPAKRDWTLRERGLAFEKAESVFEGPCIDWPDHRFDYGEDRIVSVGYLGPRMVIIVWTQRGDARHIISMRKANAREIKIYTPQFAR
jgi:uncharacterized DUF497 family protein